MECGMDLDGGGKMKNKLEAIIRAVDESRDEAVDLVQQLIRMDNCVPAGRDYDKAVEMLLPLFRDVGFEAERIDMPDEMFQKRCRSLYPAMNGVRSNLLATKNVGAKEGILWYAHLDTVPVVASQWMYPPFEGVVNDGKIWGRGTADSKSEAIAALVAFRVLKRLGIEPAYNVKVALTVDEEIGPYSGLMYLADLGTFSDYQYFNSLDGGNDLISVGGNGFMTWTIKVKGMSVHSSRSFFGVNAIERAVPLMEELLKLKDVVMARRSKAPANPEVLAETGIGVLLPVLNITIPHGGIK